jgi:hypothetical protein
MRRLSLILSDLYIPHETAPDLSVRDLPSLDWLLRFATAATRIPDWRSWVATELGAPELADQPPAQVCALGRPEPVSGPVWLATPVHLEARLDHVRLADRGLLRLGAEERQVWRAEFARTFGPQYALHDAGERAFLLSGAGAAHVASVDPARLLDADIGGALPSMPAGGELRRLGTEIEMWLHGAAVNAARERLRQRRVSALWMWGGGEAEARARVGGFGPAADDAVQLCGGDPFLVALENVASVTVTSAPTSFAALDAARCVVELTPMSGPSAESLATLEAAWFSPVREALRAGRLESLDLIANDRWFQVAARPAWRIWRKRSSWLAQLGRRASEAKA